MRAVYFDTSIPKVVLTLALKRVWPGAVFAPTSPLHFADLPEPALPGRRGIRVKNRLCGICASDLHLVFVDVDPRVHPAALPPVDRMFLGHEVVGEVVEAGTDVRHVRVGDRVLMRSRFLGGTCSTQEITPPCRSCQAGNYAICENSAAGGGSRGEGGGWGDGYTAHESEVWKVPAHLSDEAATLVEPLACGVRAVMRRPPPPSGKVLVLGCGTIGLAAIQAARAAEPSARVFAAARHSHQVEAALRFGAEMIPGRDLCMETAKVTGAKLYEGEFRNRTLLGGFDVIYDCVGTGRTITESLRATRVGGTVVIVGVDLHRMRCDLTPVWHKEVDLIGTLAHGQETWKGKPIATFDLTAEWIRQGKLATAGLITHRFPIEKWREAVQTAADKRTGSIKVVFEL